MALEIFKFSNKHQIGDLNYHISLFLFLFPNMAIKLYGIHSLIHIICRLFSTNTASGV